MGLKEKQAWAAVDGYRKNMLSDLKAAAGKDIAVELKEESFATTAMIEELPGKVIEPLVTGIQQLCSDALAKEAFQGSVEKFEIQQKEVENFEMKMNGKTLHVSANFDPQGMSGVQYPHANDYQTFFTNNL